jgi:hypothetical protein
LTNTNCYYHPSNNAVTTCIYCDKNLCVDCKFSFYLSSHLCPICYYDYLIRKFSGKVNLLKEILGSLLLLVLSSCVFILLFFLFTDYELSDYEFEKLPLSLRLFILSLSIIILIFQFRESFILRPRKFEEALSNKEEFTLSVDLSLKC